MDPRLESPQPLAGTEMPVAVEEIIRQCLPAYEIVGKLGEGVFGCVYRLRDPFKERAVKVVPVSVEASAHCPTPADLNERVSRDFLAVRRYYEQIRGPGVVEVYDFHLVGPRLEANQARAHLVILMQYCPQNLAGYVIDRFPLPAEAARGRMIELARILGRLGRQSGEGFTVTDLKPSNLLIDAQDRLCIGDLGGFKHLGSVSAGQGAQFSPNWAAPELILQGRTPDRAAQVYAFGLISYFLWEGRLPHAEAGFVERITRMQRDGVGFERRDTPDAVAELIRRCLAFEPGRRPAGFDAVLGVLEPAPPPATTAAARSVKAPARATDPVRVWREPTTGMRLVWLPGGRWPTVRIDPDGRPAAGSGTRREVVLDGFWMARDPVTQGQWEAVMGSNPARFARGPDYPVEQVSWQEAVAFARRMTARCARQGYFDLPTESEWEYAACAGDSAAIGLVPDDLDRCAWHKGNSVYSTHPVGTKRPNRFGLRDMIGNVMQWCAEIYGQRPGDTSIYAAVGSHRACRGASWRCQAHCCRPASRRLLPPTLGYAHLGLRLVCRPPGAGGDGAVSNIKA